ncbi:MAG: glycine--tRNA ligase subunit beta, partial [Janthinobacterium lividum]
VSDALAGEAAASVRLVARKRAERAALLCKADLTTGMVGEFPELQGVMGGYYARHDGEDPRVADGVRDHYLPKGPGDAVPREPVAVAVALADKLDQLVAFFLIGEKPGGSGDPFALRRAALGVIRIIRENGLRLELGVVLRAANALWAGGGREDGATPLLVDEVTGFLLERLRVQLRAEGERHDVLAAVLGAGRDDDVTRVLARTAAVAGLLGGEGGTDLLAAYRRAANILRIEDKKDGPHTGAPDPARLVQGEEVALHEALERAAPEIASALAAERYGDAMAAMGALRPPLDAFFAAVTVNDADTNLRQNRLRLLALVRDTMGQAADFSAIEG